MPHNQLRIQGGVVETETPVINQTGIATSNRIRFKPDPQGLSLPEKLGGWAKFYANAITAGVVRALWGWQDTNSNQWIAFGADSPTATELGAIQCTVSGSTGLTSATGTLQNITPSSFSTLGPLDFETAAGSNLVNYFDSQAPTITPNPQYISVYLTTPVSVGGIVLSGQYQQVTTGTYLVGDGQLIVTDILGNPIPAAFYHCCSGAANYIKYNVYRWSATYPNNNTSGDLH